MVALPSLDGLPGRKSTFRSSEYSPTQRSRKGKYPVVELWRRPDEECYSDIDKEELHHDFINKESRTSNADSYSRGNYEERRRGVGATSSDMLTALEHLHVILQLGDEQIDMVLEAFPALAEVHPDKLNIQAKLVS